MVAKLFFGSSVVNTVSRSAFAAGVLSMSFLALPASAAPGDKGSYIILNDYSIKIKGTGYNDSTTFSADSSNAESNWRLVGFPNDYLQTDVPLGYSGGANVFMPNKLVSGLYGLGASGGFNSPIPISGDTYRWVTYANYGSPSSVNPYGATAPSAGASYATSYFNSSQPSSPVPNTSGPNPIVNPSAGGTNNAGICDAGYDGPGGTTPCVTGANVYNPSNRYSYIIQTKFVAEQTGYYDFASNFTADNLVQVYLGGAISNPNAKNVGIRGGRFLAQNTDYSTGIYVENDQLAKGQLFTSLTTANVSNIRLNANQEYTLSYRVTDGWTSAGTFGGTSALIGATSFTLQPQNVPGPLPMLGFAAFLHQSRRLRRKVAGRSLKPTVR